MAHKKSKKVKKTPEKKKKSVSEKKKSSSIKKKSLSVKKNSSSIKRKIMHKVSPWIKLVTEIYNKNKHIPGYTFAKAIKDAKKIYKAGGGAGGSNVQKAKGIDDTVSEPSTSKEDTKPSSQQVGQGIKNKTSSSSTKSITKRNRRNKKGSFFSRIFG